MTRVVQSFNGSGSLVLPAGEALPGRYHIDVSYQPVRRIHAAQGHFLLEAPPLWESMEENRFAGPATIKLADGRRAEVTLAGVTGREVAISAMQPLDEDEPSGSRENMATR